jgi:hypothetical protein
MQRAALRRLLHGLCTKLEICYCASTLNLTEEILPPFVILTTMFHGPDIEIFSFAA